MTLRQIVNNYYKKISKYIFRSININPESKYIQTAGNCWIYSILNNLYLNTGIEVDPEEVKLYIKSFWINPDTGNDTKYSGTILCDYLKSKWHNLMLYEVDVMKQTKLFADLLKAWYSLTYTRDCHDNVLQDIKDNKSIDTIIISKWSWHAVNIRFQEKRLTEFGSWWTSTYNNFVYGNTDIFIKSIRAWAIQSTVRFLDFK